MADDTIVVVKEFRSRSDSELASLLDGKLDDLHKAQFKHGLKQLQQTHVLKRLKKDIARLRTLLHQRRLNKSEGEAA